MYTWVLVGHDTSDAPLSTGVSNELAAAMRSVEPLLRDRRCFVCRVIEVVPRMSVLHLGEIHVPTGREWLGRRDRHGGVHWQQHYRRDDPEAIYNLAAWDLSIQAGLACATMDACD
jgi:hypothetical protein